MLLQQKINKPFLSIGLGFPPRQLVEVGLEECFKHSYPGLTGELCYYAYLILRTFWVGDLRSPLQANPCLWKETRMREPLMPFHGVEEVFVIFIKFIKKFKSAINIASLRLVQLTKVCNLIRWCQFCKLAFKSYLAGLVN